MNGIIHENENSLERQHSCKWYFDEAKRFYDKILGDIPFNANDTQPDDPKVSQKTYLAKLDETFYSNNQDVILKSTDDFKPNVVQNSNKKLIQSLIFFDTNDAVLRPDSPRKPSPVSFFSLFVTKDKHDYSSEKKDEAEQAELFESKKFEICKMLNAIDSIISRLCTNNADHMSMLNGMVVEPKTILKWLFTAANSGENGEQEIQSINIQEKDLINTVFGQVVQWYRKQKDNRDETLKNKNLLDQLQKIFTPLSLDSTDTDESNVSKDRRTLRYNYRWNEKIIMDLSLTVKEALKQTLNDVSTAYEKLDGFRRYAIRFELATKDMKKAKYLNKLLLLAKAIHSFLLSICVSYMRINELKLPRAEFTGARLIYSNISNSNFANADFRGVDLSCAIAQSCDFSSASLANMTAVGTDFSGSLLSYSDVTGVNFTGAVLNRVKLDSANLGQRSISEMNEILNKDHKKVQILPNEQVAWEMPSLDDFTQTIIDFHKIKPEISSFLSGESIQNAFAVYNKYKEANIAQWDSLSASKEADEIFQNAVPSYQQKNRAVLKQASVKTSMLSKLDLSLIQVTAASFYDSDLSGCKMAYTSAENADFSHTNLVSAIAYRAELQYTSFVDSLAMGMWFTDCKMDSVNFTDANLTSAKIINFDSKDNDYIHKLILKEKDRRIVGSAMQLPIVRAYDEQEQTDTTQNHNNSFVNATANKIVIAEVDFSRSCFQNALFRNAILFDVNASSTVWDEADLTFAILHGVIFNRSSLKRASLQETKIYAADFTCCNLSAIKMLGCTIDQAVFYDSNLNAVNMSHSNIYNTVFRDSPIENINISNTSFVNCCFIGMDFTNCIGLSRATFNQCVFLECRDENGNIDPIDETSNSASKEKYYYIHLDAVNLYSFDTGNGLTAKFSSLDALPESVLTKIPFDEDD